jgi:hypothetical protein
VLDVDIPVRSSRLYRVSGEIRVPAPAPAAPAPAGQGTAPRPSSPVSVGFYSVLHDANAPEELSSTVSFISLQPAGNFLVGNFQATNVPPGIYAWIVNGAVSGNRVIASFPVEVRGSDVEGLRFEPRPGVTVKGTMTVDGKPPGANKGYVRFQVDGVFSRWPGSPQFDVSADEKTGAFSNPDVPTGRFRAVPGAGLPRNLYIEDVRSGGQSVFDAGFDVGTAEPVEVLLRSGTSTVSGTVIDDAGKPVVNAVVALVPPLASRQNLARFRDTYANADGKFSIPGLAPGEYKLFAWPNGSFYGAASNAAFLSRFEEKGVLVTISGKSATVTVELTAISLQVQ